MAYDQIHVVDATSQMIEIALRSSSTGMLLTGKIHSDMTVKYHREGAASASTVSVVTATKGAYTSGGFVETDIAGLYQFGIPAGALATGAKAVTITFACTGAIDVVKRIVLIGADLRNATSLGLSNLNSTVGSRASQTSLDELHNFNPAEDIVARVGSIEPDGINEGSISSNGLIAIADAVLKRDWTLVTGEASRSLLNALRFLRNKWSVSGTTLTVTKEDDATSAWTATLSTDAAADPVTGSDPA